MRRSKYIAICSSYAIAGSFDRFNMFFISRLTICQTVNIFSSMVMKISVWYFIPV